MLFIPFLARSWLTASIPDVWTSLVSNGHSLQR